MDFFGGAGGAATWLGSLISCKPMWFQIKGKRMMSFVAGGSWRRVAGGVAAAGAALLCAAAFAPPAEGVSTTNWAATGSNPDGIAVDSAGNIYTSNYASNNVSKITPDAPPIPTPTPAWSSNAKARTVTALITPVAAVSYTFTAKKGRVTKKGSCKKVTIKRGKKKLARISCTVKLSKGKWLASVTPKKGAVKGTANSKSYTFK